MPLPHASLSELCRWLFGLRRRYRVAGTSMLPLLRQGQDVLAAPVSASVTPFSVCEGDIVVARHPQQPLAIIKQIKSITKDELKLAGINQRASSEYTVRREFIVAKVTSLLG